LKLKVFEIRPGFRSNDKIKDSEASQYDLSSVILSDSEESQEEAGFKHFIRSFAPLRMTVI
jgi:hypothetical protein